MQANHSKKTEYKARAARLRAALQGMFGVDCTLSNSLELVAKEENFPNWDALSGSVPAQDAPSGAPSESALSPKAQIAQLIALKSSLEGKLSLAYLITLLSEQKNPVVSAGWSRVRFDTEALSLSSAMGQTGLFDSDAILIISIGEKSSSDLSSSVRSAIEYLRMVSSPQIA